MPYDGSSPLAGVDGKLPHLPARVMLAHQAPEYVEVLPPGYTGARVEVSGGRDNISTLDCLFDFVTTNKH